MTLPVIDEARALLEQAENEVDPVRKYDSLEEAILILKEFCTSEGTSEGEIAQASNLRQAHAKQLLRQLVNLRRVKTETWLRYVGLLVFGLKDEVQRAIADDPSLKKEYEHFVSIHDIELKSAARLVRHWR